MIRSQVYLAAIFFVFVLFLTSCKDEPILLETNLLPDSEEFGSGVDTLSVSCFTQNMDVISTFSRAFYRSPDDPTYEVPSKNPSYLPFGEVDDPVFGKTKIELLWDCYTRNADKVILMDSSYFNYRGFIRLYTKSLPRFGDTVDLDFEVYQFTDDFPVYDEDSSDFVVDESMYDPTSLVDSIAYIIDDTYTDKLLYGIEIYLKDEYIQSVLASLDYDEDDTLELKDRANDAFKLYIKPSIKDRGRNGGIQLYQTGASSSTSTSANEYSFYSYLSLTYDSYSEDTLEAINGEDSVPVLTNELMKLVPFTHFYTVHHEYTAEIEDAIGNKNSEYAYLQSIAGTQVEFSIDGLLDYMDEIKDSDILVNRVELVIPVEEGHYIDVNTHGGKYLSPPKIGLKVYNDVDSLVHLSDEYTTTDSYGATSYTSLLEGTYDEERSAYILNITGQVLNTYLSASSEAYQEYYQNRFVLFGANTSTWSVMDNYQLSRIVLNSGAYPDKNRKMQLRVLYTIKPQL